MATTAVNASLVIASITSPIGKSRGVPTALVLRGPVATHSATTCVFSSWGDQIVAEWVPLVGINYDGQDDQLNVALDNASQVIPHPREIVVDETPTGLASVAVVDAEGTRQVITLKDPLTLPAATA
jgi:Family of unknown function (DUF5335)